MKNRRMMRVGAWMLIVLLMMSALLGCNATDGGKDSGAAQDGQTDAKVPPKLENNHVALVEFTAMWYREHLQADGFQVTDGYTAQSILALFNNVEFRLLTPEEMRDVYLEVADSQFIMLEGGATVYVSDAGRVMFTIAEKGQYVTEQGAVDAEALRSLAAAVDPAKVSVE